ncbi:alpha/beta hydrolase fold domain-containing protein [Actinobaculum suis]|uniref:Alpha/beta hydrolase fold domain-containing protein n=1 Tax=Actinobaculum suis TaxID=1657 RepID=A0AAW9HRA9_9ACTO|nr:alpha/beta hydrolase fold domain-containing protein [Actinobaculum suis]MDY5152937.1 alpha/beta hydrolase fold domain-containing protein [Actinobaculum suis]
MPDLWDADTERAVAIDRKLYVSHGPRESFPSTAAYCADMRQRYDARHAWWNSGGPQMAEIRETRIPTRHGEVPVRIYYPLLCGHTQPAPSSHHPAPSSHHPAPNSHHPAPSSHHPAPGADQPASGTNQPANLPVNQPAPGANQPAPVANQPAPSTETAARVLGLPVLFFMHGGGWCVGSFASHDRLTRELAAASQAAVVAIDYTLAPMAKYPQPFTECLDVITTMLSAPYREKFHLQAAAGLAGDSCGATLALGVYLMLRESRERLGNIAANSGDSRAVNHGDAAAAAYTTAYRAITSLHLYYGSFGLQDSASARLYGGWWDGMRPTDRADYAGLFASPIPAGTGNSTGLAGPAGSGDTAALSSGNPAALSSNKVAETSNPAAPSNPATPSNPTAAMGPAGRYLDLLGSHDLTYDIPPVYIAAAELDPVLDDSRALAAILASAGLPHQFRIFPGTIHAFMQRTRVIAQARTAVVESASWFRQHLPAPNPDSENPN